MVWSREEEGQAVEVFLKKITSIPSAPANQLLGIWALKTSKATNSKDFKPYLFLRWDHLLINGSQPGEKKYGLYKTHGHKLELEIIYYEEPLRQEIWTYRFKGNDTLLLKNEKIELEYERIDYIPRY